MFKQRVNHVPSPIHSSQPTSTMSVSTPKSRFLSSISGARSKAAGLALAIAAVAIPQSAQAQQDCTQLTNPVYLTATTLLESLLERVGPILAGSGVGAQNQMSVVYVPASSCTAYATFLNNDRLEGSATYYTTSGQVGTCTIPASANIRADLMAMDVGGATCLDAFPPSDLVEFPSHVETLGFVVPRSSSQRSITATEAFYLMKYAGRLDNQIAPWTNPNNIFVRNPGSSTQLTVGANIGVSGKLWNPALSGNRGSSQVRDKVSAKNNASDAEQVLGILNSSKWESRTESMRLLAFQPFNSCLGGAIYPDSTIDARDKRNVRDGHYPIWTNLRYVARKNSANALISPQGNGTRVQRFIDLMLGNVAAPGLPLARFVVETGNIPACAMQVQRDFDGGPIRPYDHPTPCECSYLNYVGAPLPSRCTACTSNAQCGTGTCRDGFCEPR